MASSDEIPPRSQRRAATPAADGADPRAAIIAATIEIMREEGYAAVSSRRISARAGLKSKLVHYYFRTMDDLFLAVYKRIEDEHFARLTRALAADRPLHALWQLNLASTDTTMIAEIVALVNHRKALRTEVARASERLRLLQAAVLERAAGEAHIHGMVLSPTVVSIMALAISRLLSMDSALGVSGGHADILATAVEFLDRIEPPAS